MMIQKIKMEKLTENVTKINCKEDAKTLENIVKEKENILNRQKKKTNN